MHGLRFAALPRFVLTLFPAVSLTTLAADDTRVLFGFDETFDITTIANVRACGRSEEPLTLGAEELFPLVDRYGQFDHQLWPGKVHRDGDLARNRRDETAAPAAHPGPDSWNQYGGWLAGPRLEATGRDDVSTSMGALERGTAADQ